MITFDQYLEMQWARNALGAVGRRLGFGKKAATPEAPGESEFIPDEEQPAAPQPDPNMTPYGKKVGQWMGAKTDPGGKMPNYFGSGAAHVVGAYGSSMGDGHDPHDVYQFDKASMTNDNKQAYWDMKAKQAKLLVKKEINAIVEHHRQGGAKALTMRVMSVIAKRLSDYVDKLAATYRKGGQAKAGTLNTLTKKGWNRQVTEPVASESVDPQLVLEEFEQAKRVFWSNFYRPDMAMFAQEASADRDIANLYYAMRQQLGKFVWTLKIGGMPQQNAEAGV